MVSRQTAIMFLATLIGIALAGWSLFLSITLEGAGHRHFVMPERALHAPGYWYVFSWPLLLPLALTRIKFVRFSVGWLVVGQTAMALALLLAPSGISDLNRALSHGTGVSFSVFQLIVMYAFVNGTVIVAAFVPRRLKAKVT